MSEIILAAVIVSLAILIQPAVNTALALLMQHRVIKASFDEARKMQAETMAGIREHVRAEREQEMREGFLPPPYLRDDEDPDLRN